MLKRFPRFLKNTQKIQRNFCQQNGKQQQVKYEFDQTKLKMVFLGSTVGGAMLGYCIGSYLDFFGALKKDKLERQEEEIELQQQKDTNMEHFTSKWQENWDGKHEQYLKDKEEGKKRGVKYITLIRHGQYHTEAEEKEGKVLTKLGEEQAISTGKHLKKQGLKFDRMYTSDLIRAKQTGNYIAKNFKGLTTIEDEILHEGFPAPVSPVVREKINKKYKPDGDGKRIPEAFQKYISRCDTEEDQHELYVIHANVIRYFLVRVLQFPVEGWLRLSNSHCGITQIEIRPNGYVSVRRFGDSGHLQPDQVTVV